MSGEELRALAEAATPGPWRWYITADRKWAMVDGVEIPAARCSDDDNAAFIAAANPTAVLGLLDERDALRAAYDDLEAARLETMDQRNEARAQVERVRALEASWRAAALNAGKVGRETGLAASDDLHAALDGP